MRCLERHGITGPSKVMWSKVRFVWCVSDVPEGCVVPKNVAKWEGERLVFIEEREESGRKVRDGEIFSDIDPTSFMQILQKGETGKGLKTTVAIHATKVNAIDVLHQSTSQASWATVVHPSPKMQTLADALVGRWSITEKYEPDEWTPNGGVGHGEEVWRRGPGGFTLIEEVHDQTPLWESFGLALTWWDETKGLQGMWCVDSNPKGCREPGSDPGPKWDGKPYGDVAAVTSNWYWRGMRGTAQKKPFEEHGYAVDVWQRNRGRWQVVSRTSVILPGKENPIVMESSVKSRDDGVEPGLRAAMAERHRALLEGDRTLSIASRLTSTCRLTSWVAFRISQHGSANVVALSLR